MTGAKSDWTARRSPSITSASTVVTVQTTIPHKSAKGEPSALSGAEFSRCLLSWLDNVSTVLGPGTGLGVRTGKGGS
jgi:hypothetical protein